jgi:hypothetical protein
LRDGVQFAGGVADELIIENGVVWALNGANQWYMSSGSNGASWTAEAGPPDPTVAWTNGVDGIWQTASDWTLGIVPGVENSVFITAPGIYTVTDSQTTTVNGITTAVGATLDITGGTFTANAGTGSDVNAGIIKVENGAVLNIVAGTLMNSGTLQADSGGTVNLVNTTIMGGTFANSGTVDSTGNSAINGTALSNSGIVEATSGALMLAPGSATNTGTVEANGGNVIVTGALGGSAQISGNSSLELGGGSSSNVSFSAGSNGRLTFDNSQSFTGTIAGLAPGNSIDLADIAFGASTTLGYSANSDSNGGILQVNDGAHTARITLLGQYVASAFATTSDGHGGTMITDMALVTQSPLAKAHT